MTSVLPPVPDTIPPSIPRLVTRARQMGYAQPSSETGDVEGVPVVRVTLEGAEKFHDVEGYCRILPGPAREMERLAIRSALAEALVLAMSPESRR